MTGRPVTEIIEQWRDAERRREDCATAEERISLDRHIAALVDEHRAAVDAHSADAAPLGQSPQTTLEAAS